MQILIQPDGGARCIYDESIDLASIGQLQIERASQVEPNANGAWLADLSPVSGPILGPFHHRSDALRAEANWLRDNWLHPDLA